MEKVATTGRAQALTLIRQLYQEGHRFDLYQAIRILERNAGSGIVPGESANSREEPVRLASHISLAFPPNDIDRIEPPSDALGQPTLYANTLSLAGAHGPLPPPYSELLFDGNRRGDTAFNSFLDLFHHRLLAILYRQRKHLRIGMEVDAPWRGRFAERLFALMGMGTGGTRGRMAIADHRLLHYAALLTPQIRNLGALEQLVGDFFQIPVTTRPLEGGWDPLPESVYCRLGSGQAALGENTVLGKRVWNQQGRFSLLLGPIDGAKSSDFLPGGEAFSHTCEVTRFYIGDEIDFDLELQLERSSVPVATLTSRAEGTLLGWSSWLGREPRSTPGVVRLSTRRHHFRDSSELPGSFFRLLDRAAYREIPALLTPLRAAQGTILIHQGSRNKYLYIVARGEVNVVQRQPDNTNKVLMQARPGEVYGTIYGEIGMLRRQLATASVITASECMVYEIHHSAILRLLQRNEPLRHWLEQVVAVRMAQNLQ